MPGSSPKTPRSTTASNSDALHPHATRPSRLPTSRNRPAAARAVAGSGVWAGTLWPDGIRYRSTKGETDVGAKDWMLAFCDEDPRTTLRGRPAVDHAAAHVVAQRLYPGRSVTSIPDGTLGENSNPDDDVIYVGAFSGLTLACTSIAALDRPAQLPRSVIEAIPASRVYLHAMHSVVDWFAYAVWIDRRLQRSLSLAPDHGIMENEGAPLPFEEPYWAGCHPAVDPEDTDPEGEPYPFPFHPLDLAETALQDLLGFTFEGVPRADDADPFEISLAGFRIS